MEENDSFLQKLVVVASTIGWISIFILGMQIIASFTLSLFYTSDIIFKKIITKKPYPFFIFIVKYENGLKADILPLFGFVNDNIKILIIFSLLVVFFAFLKLFLTEENPLKQFGQKNILTNSFGFSQIFLTVFALETIYSIIITSLGITPHVPELPHPVIVMVVAPVEEEIAARLVLIGIPLIILDIFKIKNTTEAFKKIIKGWGEFSKTSVFLILISSVIFAQVHVECWDIWKFLPAFIAGIGLGIVFVKHGFLSAVLLHFTLNSLSYIPEIPIMGYNFPLVIILGYIYFVSGLIFLLTPLFKHIFPK